MLAMLGPPPALAKPGPSAVTWQSRCEPRRGSALRTKPCPLAVLPNPRPRRLPYRLGIGGIALAGGSVAGSSQLARFACGAMLIESSAVGPDDVAKSAPVLSVRLHTDDESNAMRSEAVVAPTVGGAGKA